MPKGGGAPRQPLSQRRPKAAIGRKPVPATSARGTRGAPPPTSKVGARKGKTTTSTSPTPTKSRTRAFSGDALAAQARVVWDQLTALYPDAHCELDYRSPWELLVATILSAQCTDKRVNMVTPELFRRWPTPADLAAAPPSAVEDVIRSTGFFRAKARSLNGAAVAVSERHAGELPRTIAELITLPGVGRKTANVVLGNAFGINEGVVVDTHVGRLALRLGLTRETDPVKVEQDLMRAFPAEHWTLLSHRLIWHGRRVCDARKPRCGDCPLRTHCPSALV
ncbi:MAG: endonuclease III [Gemmatimonadetes bacterium]|nr:endonuclease III [Gemmatimonadota bacterium]